MRRTTAALILGCAAVVGALAGPGRAQALQINDGRFRFIGVGQEADWAEADDAMRDSILNAQNGIQFVPGMDSLYTLPYDQAIETLVTWSDSIPFLARATPYVFAAAELRGAQMKIVAVARSDSTKQMTYNSYFVVKKSRYVRNGVPYPADVDGVLEYLGSLDNPVEFIYHSRYSTSSYFLPALFFRKNNIASGGGVMTTRQITTQSSKALVRDVANQGDDEGHLFAAVWTGTKKYFEDAAGDDNAAARDSVLFIELPGELPNDLLVTQPHVDPGDLHYALLNANDQSKYIGLNDVDSWVDIDTPDGRKADAALADLRLSARQRVAPLVVQIVTAPGADSLLEAARQAVRLSGGEFTLYEEAYHRGNRAYEWNLEDVHFNKAALLKSTVWRSLQLETQTFNISYDGVEDLTSRIGTIMRTRLHRVRYLWPYNNEDPTVLRDVDFGLEPGDVVHVRKVTVFDAARGVIGVDPQDEAVEVAIRAANLYTFQLDSAQVRAITNPDPAVDGLGLDPMSQTAYRVVLVRSSDEPMIFRVLTVVLVLLFALAGYWAVRFDLMKREWA